MALHTDIPTRRQIERLLSHRSLSSVSIYLPTNRVAQGGHQDRIELKNLVGTAVEQLRAVGTDEHEIRGLEEAFHDLVEDDEFWNVQADSLAIFASPSGLQTYRLPNHLSESVEVSDRFHVMPLLRALTFPQAAFVLALALGSVRLLQISAAEAPQEVHVPDLPRDVRATAGNRVFKDRDRHYARRIDHALRSVLAGSDLPLILAATEGMDAVYRSVNTYPHLAESRSVGNPEATSDAELATAARAILDELYVEQLKGIAELFDVRSSQGRAATDVTDVARLATMGAVDTVLVDIDAVEPGFIDEASGAVTFDTEDDAVNYDVIDEIARRVYSASGHVLAVRSGDIPGGGPVAAILRYVI